jgi:monoamine oxidase
VAGHQAWQRLGKYLQPEVERFCLAEQRWDGGIASALGRQSVAAWLERARVPREMRDVAVGLRGFFLADPDELSLLALVDQFAEEGPPGNEKMFRIKGGNSLLPERLATSLGNQLNLQAVLRSVRQHARGVTVKIEQRGRLEQIGSDYLICTIPASTLRDVSFDPAMPVEQRDAVTRLKYGAVTKSALQFDRITWRKRGRPRAFGSSLPIGAVWDGNEDQKGSHGILSLMAGGRASDATRQILSEQGPAGIVKELTWLGLQDTEPVAWDSISWEHDQWARGGYAYIDPGFAPVLREWLARPFGRVFFAGEHTSMKWQGYMNGAVESGLRAATEVALAQLSLRSSQ